MIVKDRNRTVLISYATADRAWVEGFAHVLRGRGFAVLPNELMLQPGEDGLSAIEEGLRAADDIVFLVTGDIASQPWMFFEFGVAATGGKRFVPVVPEDLDLSSFPVPMQSRRYVVRRSPEQTAAELYGARNLTRTA